MASSLLLSNPFLTSPHNPNNLTRRQQPLTLRPSSAFTLLSLTKPSNNNNNPKFLKPTVPFLGFKKFATRISTKDADTDTSVPPPLAGEDSAAFELGKQKVVMFILILIFATVHSGLASLRDMGEKLIGERAFRVLFAGVSLPLAVSTVVYFINHRYDGIQLWELQSAPAVHQLVWLSNFISFLFLYPSTFNLLEVAAVDKPKMHLWETGIMRITRHPQMVGQVMWCLAHTVWIGNSVTVAASLGLIGHHLFGVWNGDRRLATRYGEAFEAVKKRTSIVPFAAILDGRQKLPKDYYKEFLRLPYLSITALTLGAYFAHPLMQAASFRLHW
ncbi:15-cis-zeta-carotene isomerase, chloroplastic isoform X2 [Populus trichocarpa]|uniref:15-cis-zeta-carotene isomerase, chloroplastic isoform X2 n=1 Tax=Populus trichocarpa TaxID=3694 RepID=UPI000CCD834F|nr:15-cis-zeta-carotene isomerase, chloroplastic isoform X2 [Populus trichocarpa]|eukprot:XP_024440157.1 15-cis-zeta-carotene isomerase, chloroplastic isoform X2 [Populus trichocarpa]